MKELKLKTTTGEEVTLKFEHGGRSWFLVDLVEQEEAKSAPVPTAGQWSAWQNKPDPKHPFYITKIEEGVVWGIDLYSSKEVNQCGTEYLVPVTTEEIESAFRKEATRRGFERGKELKGVHGCEYTCGGQMWVDMFHNWFVFGTTVIWDITNGWATPLSDLKPVPKTKKDIMVFMTAYNLFEGTLSDFVKQHAFD
jgi:hypothetical protein